MASTMVMDEKGASNADEYETELIFWLPDHVQLVVIEDGITNVPSPPTSLAIFEIKDGHDKCPSDPIAVICVGPWAYPLCGKEKTAILKNELGIYVVHNPTPQKPDMYVGIILPRDMDKTLEDDFVYALGLFASLKISESTQIVNLEQRKRTSHRIASFLIKSGDFLASSTQNVANKTSKYVQDEGERRRLGMQPTGTPTQINPAIKYGARILHVGGKFASKTTKSVLDKIGDFGISVGKAVARKLGGEGDENSSNRLVSGAANVVSGGITAASTVWISLEDASKALFRCFADETVKTVHIRYGDQSSEVVHDAIYGIGHTTLAGIQIYELGPRSIAGRMARKAGLQVVKQYANNSAESSSVPTLTKDGKS